MARVTAAAFREGERVLAGQLLVRLDTRDLSRRREQAAAGQDVARAALSLAQVNVERMRALVEALPPRTLGNDTQTITVSAGVVCRVPAAGEGAETLLRDADAALYRAKRDGRNCVRE